MDRFTDRAIHFLYGLLNGYDVNTIDETCNFYGISN